MKVYKVTLRVDQEWMNALDKLTFDVYEGEICQWLEVEEEKEGAGE